jgi:hypothetical protein
MTTTPYTQAMVDALKVALASGTLTVSYEGKTVTYRTLSDIQSTINMMQRELDTAAGKKSSRTIRVKSSRGLEGPVRSCWRNMMSWWLQ